VIRSAGELAEDCARCQDLQARFADPASPNPGAYLYRWAVHRLDEHGATGRPRPGCQECARFAAGPDGVREAIWQRWAQVHYMKCRLAPDWSAPGR
jgi:hypothetical protein